MMLGDESVQLGTTMSIRLVNFDNKAGAKLSWASINSGENCLAKTHGTAWPELLVFEQFL